MAKRRISKASKRRLTFFGTFSVIVIVYFLFSLIYNGYTIYRLSMQKKELDGLYTELQEEAEELKIDIEKFNDSDYLANYAREHYLYSKPGEYIIKLDPEEVKEDIDDIGIQINKNYLIIGLSFIMAFVFIYIIVKSKKK